MKKIFFGLMLSAAMFSSAFTYASATETLISKEPGTQVKKAFSNEFSGIGNVKWSTVDNNSGVYQAQFSFNNETLQAFFTEEGEFLGTTRQIVKSQLPVLVAASLEKQYSGARVVTIFEYSKKDGLDYYITLTTDKGSMILKGISNGELSVYKKNIK